MLNYAIAIAAGPFRSGAIAAGAVEVTEVLFFTSLLLLVVTAVSVGANNTADTAGQ